MRHQAQAKLGYYPADPLAIECLLRHLKLPDAGPKGIQILDPCAGQGAAIKQIAEGLKLPEKNVYAVELSADRGRLIREAMPDAHVLAPCSYSGTWITAGSFGLAYVNPPFDDELGGGSREEHNFTRRAWGQLAVGGVLVLVAPLNSIAGKSQFCNFLDSSFEDLRIYKFPDAVRKYNEVVVIGRKRKDQLTDNAIYTLGTLKKAEIGYSSYGLEAELSTLGDETYWSLVNRRRYKKEGIAVYPLQTAWKPHKFAKTDYLDEELYEALQRSPLNVHVKEYREPAVARPPLPPARGHVALLLASGMLDGEVEADGVVHVVRGNATKVEYYNEEASKSTEDTETGAVTTKDVYSQRVQLMLRAVWPDGEIHTFSDVAEAEADGSSKPAPEPEPEGESTPLIDEAMERVKLKIRNLMSRTEEAGCTEAEADEAALKARTLMDDHGLSLFDLSD